MTKTKTIYPEVKIGTLAHSEPGSFKIGPFGSSLKKDELVSNGIPVAGIENVLSNKFVPSFRKFITKEKFNQLSDYEVKAGDVLVTTMGTIGRAAVVPDSIGTVIIDSHLFRMRIDQSKVYPAYLCYAINGYSGLKQQLVQMSSGAIMAGLNTKILKECSLPLPPLSEQKRIAAILNEQMEAVERSRQATLAQLEAGEALPAAYLRAVFNSPEAQKWERKLLGEIAILERGKFTPRPRNDPRYYGGQYPWIQTGEVEASRKYIKTYRNTLNDAGLAVSKMFPKGTLVITIAATIGAVGILTFDSCMPDSLVGITPREGVSNTEFLYNALLFIRNHLKSIAPQVAQANLKLSLLEPLEIPTPPLPEQERIAATLNEQMAEVERLKQSLKFQLDAINKLPATLLRRAFNGEL